MPTPVYLLKAELDDFLESLGSYVSTRSSEADTAHWALEINGRQYQLEKGRSKGLRLNLSEPIPRYKIRYRRSVGNTRLRGWEVEKASREVINWMRENYGDYDAFSVNCQAFANHLWHRIRARDEPEPRLDLLGLSMSTCAGIDYNAPCSTKKRSLLEWNIADAFSSGLFAGFFKGAGTGFFSFLNRGTAFILGSVANIKRLLK